MNFGNTFSDFIKKKPLIAPLSEPYLEIVEGTSNETVCWVDTSVGVSPVWLHLDGTEVTEVTTTCLNAECFCQGTSAGIFYVLTTNEVHDGALISQHKLTLFICNANQSFQGNYSCLVKSKENGYEDVNMTFTLSVTESSDQNLIILIGIPLLIVLVVLNVVAISTMAACCLCLRNKYKRKQEATVDNLPIPGHVNNYYSRPPESRI